MTSAGSAGCRAVLLAAALTCFAAAASGAPHAPHATPKARPGAQPFDRVTAFRGDAAGRTVRLLPSAFRSPFGHGVGTAVPSAPVSPASKLHPYLRFILSDTSAHAHPESADVIVTWRDTLRLPLFPVLRGGGSPAGPNAAVLARIDSLIQSIRSVRAREYLADTLALRLNGGGRVLRTYWLIRGALVRAPLDQILPVAADSSIVSVDLGNGPEVPPRDSTSVGTVCDDMEAACADIGARSFGRDGYGVGGITLLDTGIRSTHERLSNPSPIASSVDMTATSGTGNPVDECEGHGTLTAGILAGNGRVTVESGNGSLQEQWSRECEGVTVKTATKGAPFLSASIHSVKVYSTTPPPCVPPGTACARCPNTDTSCRLYLDHDAVVRAFQTGIAMGDKVVVAEMEAQTSNHSPISLAADHAFDTGHVVIAANGNYAGDCGLGACGSVWESGGCVASPANARKVIGAGAYVMGDEKDADGDFKTYAGQSLGPTEDGRIKPDLQAPTEIVAPSNEDADNMGDRMYRGHGGTSGATPFAAGAALLAWNWMQSKTTSPVDAGQVYAHLILSTHHAASASGSGSQLPASSSVSAATCATIVDQILAQGAKVNLGGPIPNLPATTPFDDTRGAGLLRLAKSSSSWFGEVSVGNNEAVLIPLDFPSRPPRKVEAAIWWPEGFDQESDGSVKDTRSDVDLVLLSPTCEVAAAGQLRRGVWERVGADGGGLTGRWVLVILGARIPIAAQDVYFSARGR